MPRLPRYRTGDAEIDQQIAELIARLGDDIRNSDLLFELMVSTVRLARDHVSRGDLKLNLSEHHGDGTPGSIVYVHTAGVRELQRELSEKKYRYNRPGLTEQEWGMLEFYVTDPFNNRITFAEPIDKPAG